jgi:hypothetical protein
MIILISMGTITSSVVIGVQKMGRLGERLSPRVVRLTWFLSNLSFTRIPSHLRHETDQCPVRTFNYGQRVQPCSLRRATRLAMRTRSYRGVVHARIATKA